MDYVTRFVLEALKLGNSSRAARSQRQVAVIYNMKFIVLACILSIFSRF